LKEELLDERDLQKFAKSSKTKIIKENTRKKDNARNYNNTLHHPNSCDKQDNDSPLVP